MKLKHSATTKSAQPPSVLPLLRRLPSAPFCLHILTFNLSEASYCYEMGNFTAASDYAKNRDLVLSSLPSNMASNSGFYSRNIGTGSNIVYVLSFCRGDSSNDTCFKCISSAAEELMVKCPNQKAAFSWGTGVPPCFIRYSNAPMYGVKQTFPTIPVYCAGDIPMDQNQFDQIWSNLTQVLAARASMGTSELKFAAGSTMLPNLQTVFALLQCCPDLSRVDCDSCLGECINDYQGCCHGRQGGVVYKPSCIFRWELYPFLESNPGNPPSSPRLPTGTAKANPPARPPSNAQVTSGNMSKSLRIVIGVVGSTVLFVMVILSVCCFIRWRRSDPWKISTAKDKVETTEILQFKISNIRAATDFFSEANKLGEGRFGKVYQGKLENGQYIAVKRLEGCSNQGQQHFKNEVTLMARLQHKNLIKLHGYCLEEGERLLTLESAPNASLEGYISCTNLDVQICRFYFTESVKRTLLSWERHLSIIREIAQGLLYLHEDSRLRIIHRDVKPGNVLNMNPKISDFGTARLFVLDQRRDNTARITGTFGVKHEEISVKTDVYSFGIVVLEIISGKKNSYYSSSGNSEHLLSYAWKNWRKGTPFRFIDKMLNGSLRSKMSRCIHIALLCVQENVERRPTMASVVLMLESQSTTLPTPTRPAYFDRCQQ